MTREFHQVAWDAQLEADWQRLLELAMEEDLGRLGDCTTMALVPADALGRAAVVARQSGVIAGLAAVESTLRRFDPRLRWSPEMQDGASAPPNARLGRIEGPARGILAAERVLLNLLGRLSGVATLTRRYVAAVAGTKARIYDTRKTTPGWRRLEKYAVRCGGGWNHRSGLFEAVLIKDNHIALWKKRDWGLGIRDWREGGTCAPPVLPPDTGETPVPPIGKIPTPSLQSPIPNPQSLCAAVFVARRYLNSLPATPDRPTIVEVEVDSLQQLDEVLPAEPDLVLLDNMDVDTLRQAVVRRDRINAAIELEGSGGIDLNTVRRVAQTGVERISIGALTHSAVALDIGLDWLGGNL